jgi:hypothetical protein
VKGAAVIRQQTRGMAPRVLHGAHRCGSRRACATGRARRASDTREGSTESMALARSTGRLAGAVQRAHAGPRAARCTGGCRPGSFTSHQGAQSAARTGRLARAGPSAEPMTPYRPVHCR